MTFKAILTGAIFSGALVTGAQAATFGDLYAFGDSLNDCCINPGAPFTNGDQTWLVELADAIGATYEEPSAENPDATVTNYAVGGAQSGDVNAIAGGTPEDPLFAPNGLQSQIDQFQLDAPEITEDDLAVIWVGTNDIWASSYDSDLLFGIDGLNVVKPLGNDPTPEDLAAYIAGNIQTAIEDLAAAGFGSVLLLTPFDMGNSALIDSPEAIAQNTIYSDVLRDVLLGLYTPGIDTYVLDVFEIIAGIQAGAPENGFTSLTGFTPCDGLDAACLARTQEEQDSYVFLDFVHLTTATNSIIAAEAADLLMNGSPVPVPLPAAGWMLIAGLGGLGALRLGARRAA